MTSPTEALASLWPTLGGETGALERIEIAGDDPFYPSPFRVGTAAAATVGAAALAAAELWAQRTGRRQSARIDLRHAAIAFRSERYLRVDGVPLRSPWGSLARYYRTADGRFIQLHMNYPHHEQRALGVLDVPAERDAVEQAVGTWQAQDLEDALAAAGACATVMRTREQWRSQPQGEAIAALPLVEAEHRGHASAEPLPAAARPLDGVRVLDLTRVIAGPVCGRTLAAYGADVLRIGTEALPDTEALVVDTSFGKRFAHLDLRSEQGRDALRALIREADVFVQGYRPAAIQGLGFGFEEVARLRPGIVYVSLCAWSRAGPWAQRRGFDSLVQTASGIAHEGGAWAGLDEPGPLPAQALDHASGYLAAAAATLALLRRAREGGSTHVRLSLAQTGRWIESLGRVDGAGRPDPRSDDVRDLLATVPSERGTLTYVRPAGMLDETPPQWTTPPPRAGADAPVWRER